MKNRFLNIIESLLKPSQNVLVAVSGGLDSVVLLDLVSKSKISFSIAHANFQLRDLESDQDQLFVKGLAKKYNVPFHTINFDTLAFAGNNGLSKQMAARELRYKWFNDVMDQEQIDFLLTAHHLNDNLETSLLNIIRGTGISGMRGMHLQRGRTIRPLLEFTRTEIENYATQHQLKWREDSSNKSVDYHRNYIRQQVIPSLKQINPSLEKTFHQNANRLKAEEELMHFALEALTKQYVIKQNNQLIINKKLVAGFNYKAGIIWELTKEFGFNLDQCESIIASLNGESGKQFYAPSFTLTVDRENLIVSKQLEERQLIQISENDDFITTNQLEISIHKSTLQHFSNNRNEACLDTALLEFPLTIRIWKQGDSFYPLGMKNKKKVSDFLIDQKVSLADKSQVLVMESGQNIVWLIGHRIDDRYKITTHTKTAHTFKITIRNS